MQIQQRQHGGPDIGQSDDIDVEISKTVSSVFIDWCD